MRMIRVGICFLVVFSVLAFGTVQLWSQTVLELGTMILFLFWAFSALRRQEIDIHWNWLYLPLLGLWGVILVQYGFGLSLASYLTKVELFKWTCCLLLCFLAVESFRTSEERRRFAWFLLSFCFLVSLFALTQYFAFNGKLYWLVTLPQNSGPFGPFVNHNHFAGFVELAEPMGLALLLSGSERSDSTPLLILFAVLPVAALLISGSRGGVLSFSIEVLLLAWILRREMTSKRKLPARIALGLIAIALILWLGIGRTVRRFSNLASQDISKDTRILIYKGAWQIFRNHPWVGTGAGTFQTVYPHYATHYDALMVDHAHNDYLEFLSETGLVGAIFGLCFLAIFFLRASANLRASRSSRASPRSALTRSLYAGGLVACVGLLMHGLVDFNFQIPSNAALFLILAGLTTSDKNSRSGSAGRDQT
ncbi:MAG: O-antigen ligase family protein [Candidatus Acidiferrales bacterium]